MKLNKLSYNEGARNHKEKRVGRGFGSGIGKTSTRGSKGQNSRKSGGTRLGFEGGQTPLYRRIPKVGFNNKNFENAYNVITLDMISKWNVTEINYKSLVEKKLIQDNNLPIKIIGSTEIKKPLNVSVHKISKGAIAALEKSKSKFSIVSAEKSKTIKSTKK
ncbi:50S ribosomal protein L15 [Malacoplasma iowae]|uniref:Large ribosomal subunit protein uL15 n=2 Tax=Malacoplasma iowae TaxID=2116 RepID=A0A084U336_MALIO|nr:50S ribosomal protein L15 [Malacoplasma iowae]VEU62070.1 50S ribosomal protein L15 [Mycoplasmopsis fermentans]EGZ31609.1 50S ribosomal protein L15 [Malacoplasma iowae 695]KFB07372.1 ribosomal protein L15 [Malacoplasma iowae DK-CPA]QHG89983.1 50S ribosomal protein L15 [Malacoplasma iowae 695]WPL36292.1 50S ribosomal protein L15 [Malacoplasma iowae]